MLNIKAAIYARKSKFTEKGDSIENQIKMCKSHTENMDIDEYFIYRDEGFSAKNTERPGFLRMMEDAKKGKFKVIICYKLDRFSRSVSDFATTVNILEKIGVDFISINEKFDTSSAIGRAMMYISSVFSQLERENVSIRVRDNMYSLSQIGYFLGGETPTGFESKRISFTDAYGKDRTYCILSPKEDELKLVELIYKKYLELGSLSKVLKYMHIKELTTKNDKRWSLTTLRGILSNPVYVRADNSIVEYFKSINANVFGEVDGKHGILTYNRKQGKNGKKRNIEDWVYAVSNHEGIIDSKEWLSVQNALELNKSKAPPRVPSNKALLSGMIRCANCNSFMRIAYAKKYDVKKEPKFYYMCSLKHDSGKTRCDTRNINGLELDKIIIDKIKEMSLDKNTLTSELKRYKYEIENPIKPVEKQDLEKEIEENKSKIENLLNNLSLANDKETVQIIMEKIKNLKDINKINSEKLENIKSKEINDSNIIYDTDSFIKALKNFQQLIDEATIEEKQSLISSIIEKVYADGTSGNIRIKFKGVDI